MAAASNRPVHPSMQLWEEERKSNSSPKQLTAWAASSKTHERAIANHAQLAVQVAEAAVFRRQYGNSAAWLSPHAMEWLVAACIHDCANAAAVGSYESDGIRLQRWSSSPDHAALESRRHVQYATLSRAIGKPPWQSCGFAIHRNIRL